MIIATLGAGFVFSTILSDIPEPVSVFSLARIRFFLAVSLLLFMWALALACIIPLILLFVGRELDEIWRKDTKLTVGSFVMCIIILSMLITAFIFIGLVIMAYEFWVGIVGIGSAGFVWTMSIILGMIELYRELKVKRRDEGKSIQLVGL